jgi:hypothetical protein
LDPQRQFRGGSCAVSIVSRKRGHDHRRYQIADGRYKTKVDLGLLGP